MSSPALDANRRALVTPEGVDLEISLADIGARIGAMTIDIAIIFAMFIGSIYVFAKIGFDSGSEETATLLIILFAFFLRSFYFMFFEMGRRAATPGKRIVKIRVAARGKPRLSANAVFARNALREIEFFLPLSFMSASGATGVDGWIALAGLIWSGIFLFFPLMNKDKLRAGDIIAGTWVVKTPRPILAPDLAGRRVDGRERFAFSPQQIEVYGVKELHVLEDVLRAKSPDIMHDVAARIRRKIEWAPAGIETDYDFLSAYYAALRGRLETRMLMGVRRTDKYDTR